MNTVSMLNAVDIIVPIFAVLGVIILLVVVIILLFLLNKKMQITNIQIPPENRKVIDGTVIKCKYLGSYTTSWGYL
ncbi:MAG: hypothetical protein FWE01_01185 [Firmicutes bacterium]|nr:hypothetical protein [Bacillota bacterium]